MIDAGEESGPPSAVTVTGSGPVAVGGGDITITGSAAAGRDLIIERLTVIADDGAPFGDLAARPGAAADVCPYPGIQSFVKDQRAYFVGRDRDRRAVIDLLDRASLVAVVGGSGSGKSSLLAAGVVPDFVEAGSTTAAQWQVQTLRPGSRPADRITELRGFLTEGHPTLWVVDQLEEVFGRQVAADQRDRFLTGLVDLSSDGRSKVLVALRSDFYPSLDLHRPIADAIAAHQHRLLPLDTDSLRDVVVIPAERVGLRVEPALVDHIVADVDPSTNQLPLLAYAMRETWRRRRNGWLTLAGYVEAGGVSEALEKGARSVWLELTPSQRETTKHIFLRLTNADGGRAPTKQRATVESLITDVDGLDDVVDVLERFTRERLLVPDIDSAGRPTVDIAHEALLREWSVLRDLLEEDVESRRMQRELARAARVWQDGGREPAGLLGGRRLQLVRDAHRAGQLTLNDDERRFLDASVKRMTHDRRRSLLLWVLPAVLIMALVAAGVLTVQQQRTNEQKTIADSLQLAAEARSLISSQRDAAALLAVSAWQTDANHTTLGTLIDSVGVPDGPLAYPVVRGARASAIAPTFAADGTALVGASDGSLRVFDPATGDEVDSIDTGLQSVSAICQLPDGTIIAGGSDGGVAVIPAGGERTEVFRGPTTSIRSVAFEPKGRIVIATTDRDVWRAKLDAPTDSLEPMTISGQPLAIAVTDDSGGPAIAVATNNGRLQRLDLESGELRGVVIENAFAGTDRITMTALPDGRLVVGDGAGLRRWDLTAGAAVDPPGEPGGAIAAVAAPAGDVVFTGTESGEVQTWTLDPRPIQVGPGRAASLHPIRAVASDGVTVVALDASAQLVAWDVAGHRSPAVKVLAEHGNGVLALANSPAGRIASGDRDGVIEVSTPDGTRTQLTDIRTAVRGLAWLGESELVVGGADGSVRIVDTVTANSRAIAPASGIPIVGVASTQSGLIAFATREGRVTVIRPDRTIELKTSSAPLLSLALSPSGDAVAVGSDGPANDISLWDLRDGSVEPRLLAGHTRQVTSVAFAPAGDLLASGSDDQDIRLWAIPSGEPRGTLKGHTDLVQALAFGADGTLLVSGSEDFTVRIWEVGEQRQVGQPWRWAPGPIWALVVSGDGRSVAAANATTVVEWAFGEQEWIERACRLAVRELTPDELAVLSPGRPPSAACS